MGRTESRLGEPQPNRARARAHLRQMGAEARGDDSLVGLLLANFFALAVAWYTGMSLRELMLTYWIQSVVIGVSSFLRIRHLKRFDPSGFQLNNRPAQETPRDKHLTAGFFLLHYGFFHAVYFVFLVADAKPGEIGPLPGYLACALAFVINHAYSLRRNLARDSRGRPKLGTLMFLPYARIIPMHAILVLGHFLASGGFLLFGILLFGLLKTAADLAMHVVEHHVLSRSGTAEPAILP